MKQHNCPLAEQTSHQPQQTALITPSQKITFMKLHELAIQIEFFFKKKKINKLKKGAILLDNHWHTVILLIVFYRLKVIFLPLNTKKPKLKLINEIKKSQSDFIIAEKQFSQLMDWKKNSLIFLEKKTLPLKLPIKSPFPPNKKSKDLKKKINLTHPMLNLFTSGSMGYEKLAVFSLKNILANSKVSNQFLDYGREDNWLISLPLYHISGISIVFRWLISGGKISFLNKSSQKLKKLNFLPIISQLNITHLSLVIAQFKALILNSKKKELNHLKKLKAILVGGSTIPSTIWKLTKQYPLYPTYGMTESIAQVATYDGEKKFWLKLLPNRKVKINPHNQEILLHPDSLFLYYQGERNNWKKKWFPTGDKGKIKKIRNQVFIKIIGRLDNQFISGGENIQAEEIEEHLLNIPFITKAIVTGKENKEWGKLPIAFICLDKKKSPTQNLISKINQQLATKIEKYKIPIEYYFLTNPTSKVNFKQLNNNFKKYKKLS